MAPLSHKKKDRGTSKLCFTHKDQSVRLNFELSYNERTLELNAKLQHSLFTVINNKFFK